MYKRREKRGFAKWIILLVFIVAIAGGIYYVLHTYTIQTVYVEGNLHYAQEEIKDIVMGGPLGNNSLYLSLKYKHKGIKDVPFVDEMDVTILSPDTIKISVYEKALAGYIKFMDSYMYFDKDGYIAECSSIKTEGIPQITGLSFEYVALGQMLPVENDDIFKNIMSITKLMNKYELNADKIYFPSTKDVVIYFKEVKVILGSDNSQLEDKIMLLPQLLENVIDKKGILHMENSNITFEPDTNETG